MKPVCLLVVSLLMALPVWAQSTLGPQKTIVLLLNQPADAGDHATWVMQNANTILDHASDHRTSFTGVKHPVSDIVSITANYDTPGCSTTSAQSAAQVAAQALGYDLTQYDRELIVMNDAGCTGWIGLTSSPKVLFFNAWFDPAVVAHEMGHALGAQHSHALQCGPVAFPVNPLATCQIWDRGNKWDVMGQGNGDYNADSKRRIWADPVPTITADGDYTLSPLDDGVLGPREGLKFADMAGHSLVLEYRPASDLGLIVNWHDELSQEDYLIDLTPGDYFMGNAGLKLGQAWTDPNSGVTLTHVSSTPTQLVVRVAGLSRVLTLTAGGTLTATSPTNAPIPVSFPLPTVAGGTPPYTGPTCTPASGTLFSVGTTLVSCTVTDAATHSAQASFTVVVTGSAPVDCVVGPWTNAKIDVTTSPIVTSGATQTRTVTTVSQQTRTIFQQPANGGAACPTN